MDDPALPTERLFGALAGLVRLNSVSNSPRIVWPPIASLARQLKTSHLRVLDIASGAGDIPIALSKKASRVGLKLDIHGIDFSPRSVEFARQRAEAAGVLIEFECRNALTSDMPSNFDVVMCSLFLHHLSDGDALKLLAKMKTASRHLVLVSDLRRGWYGLSLAYVASRVLSRSTVVHGDAVQSVRAAFTQAELTQLAERAGIGNATIAHRWPGRMLLQWGRHSCLP